MAFIPNQDLPYPHPDFDGRRMAASPSLFATVARAWCPRSVTLEIPCCTVSRYALRLINKADGKAYSLDEILTYLSGVTSVAGKTGEVTLEISDIAGLSSALDGASPHAIAVESLEDEGEGYWVSGDVPPAAQGLLIASPDTVGGGSIPTRKCWTDDGSQVTMQDTVIAALTGSWKRAVFQAEDYWRLVYRIGGLAFEFFAPLGVHTTPDTVTGWQPALSGSVGGYPGYGDAYGEGPSITEYSSVGTSGTTPGQLIFRTTDGSYFVRRPGSGPIRFDFLR